ncbi:MAG: hypothetical protein UT55_C0003G0010 [Candidatus Peregrinibacteria bacterium GW2011_GWE2_39_6]|nr:MAG: hypothetical protein UT36_C0005G0101 [Candidatus Peregrinibacteria bacterium GW2011_GWF2_39_17]KKR26699.1 MAG: hypothetical protein UT55_C0003G0010 [Candidatus Peregrinibacteria bacterium GW2011_GWE2_39_6]HCW32936.1 50S ribosomal protein L32 [Candidatus Peregrinibacteria bacterium]
MAKHSVPKRKQSKTRSNRRYKTFANATRVRLANAAVTAPCEACGAMKRLHYVCSQCGKYRGRQVIDKQKEIDKITKVQV